VPRCLIVGCGCRGLELARELRARGHVVRATTRRAEQLALIEADGFEGQIADPDRVASVAPALAHVAIAYLLLGCARGSVEALEALHTTRLQMLLERMLDSTVRGIVYEAAGTLDGELLAGGAAIVRSVCERSRIPYALLDGDPGDLPAWLALAAELPERLLAPR
jgi:nucleoside-diphosphate-sugar epimerase